jgi:NADP-dependent 3-hydroxy acid dehydrogenase YdfG
VHTLNRTLVITGVSSGIGRATARKMLQQGHQVIGISRDCSQFTQAHEHFTPIELDLANLNQLPEKLAHLDKKFPHIDTLVCCAGFGQFGSLEEFSYTQIQTMINTNLTSQVFLARALIPGLKQKPASDIVFIGSEAALKGSRKGSVYCAGKFALRGFAQALREECARSNVRVSLINPGMVKTAFFDKLSFQPGEDHSNFIQPNDVADAVSFILNANPAMVIDEINMSPLNKVIKFK